MPYVSDKQRKYFHYAESVGKIAPKVVKEFDKASKGKKLPEYKAKDNKKKAAHKGIVKGLTD